MVFLSDGSCLGKGAGYVGAGGSAGVLLCFGISSLSCCPELLSAQPGFRRHSRCLICWKMGILTKFMFSLSLGHRNFPACLRDHWGFAAMPGRCPVCSWPPLPTLMLKGLCNHVGNWVREMIQLKAVLSNIKSRI